MVAAVRRPNRPAHGARRAPRPLRLGGRPSEPVRCGPPGQRRSEAARPGAAAQWLARVNGPRGGAGIHWGRVQLGASVCPEGERSGLSANLVCFVSKSVLWCFALFRGVLRVFCGVLQVFFEKQCFAVFCGCFAMFWTCFANVFCRHFLSERKTHSTVLRCIAQSVFCSFCAFCIFFGMFWSVL